MEYDEGSCVAKFGLRFTPIETDHEIEQENRALKVLGGIKGRGY